MASTISLKAMPWLLYCYPWMPYPRRVQLYLREKGIPSSAVKVVQVSDPQNGDCVVESQADKYPPRPIGSLPILAIPPQSSHDQWTYVRQSMAIIEFLEEETGPNGVLSHIKTRQLHTGDTALERARLTELRVLAEELTVSWNPVRMFGSGAGTMKYPEGAREMLRWVSRILAHVDRYMTDRDFEALENEETSVSVADITLYQFLEFVHYCYGVDITEGTGANIKDVYGRDAKDTYPNLKAFYKAVGGRKSAIRVEEEGEYAAEDVLAKMKTWHESVW